MIRARSSLLGTFLALAFVGETSLLENGYRRAGRAYLQYQKRGPPISKKAHQCEYFPGALAGCSGRADPVFSRCSYSLMVGVPQKNLSQNNFPTHRWQL